jgi:hypothetical protein
MVRKNWALEAIISMGMRSKTSGGGGYVKEALDKSSNQSATTLVG